MKSLKCSDLGASDCTFEATGESDEEIIQKMFAHAAEVHKDKLAGMTDEQKKVMMDKMGELLSKQE
ncbi:hypothetical protein CMO83_05260 [Candidatus Woesearchaeota archaeon]|jgi:predicted small metal-binding protein|nr:hypothetical protein [Candidatus Woesearchaeota archaeon]|tara:strand:- start:1930 stop:2127 length:198 start_codon:yes stop_codon:yes gene_type:complete